MRWPSTTSNTIRPTWPGTVVTTVAGVPSVAAVTTASETAAEAGAPAVAAASMRLSVSSAASLARTCILVLRGEREDRSAQFYGSPAPTDHLRR